MGRYNKLSHINSEHMVMLTQGSKENSIPPQTCGYEMISTSGILVVQMKDVDITHLKVFIIDTPSVIITKRTSHSLLQFSVSTVNLITLITSCLFSDKKKVTHDT